MNNDIMLSLFGLINSNNGQFKSEKQAAFIRRFADGDVFTGFKDYAFGEFQGCKVRNEYRFTLSAQGIEEVIKVDSKANQSVYWANTQEHKNRVADKQTKKLASERAWNYNKALNIHIDHLDALLKRVKDAFAEFLLTVEVNEDLYNNPTVLKYKSAMNAVKSNISAKEAKYSKLVKAAN